MSEWHNLKDDDIDIDSLIKEVNIWVKSNDQGNVYVALTFDQIKQIHKQILGLEKQEEVDQSNKRIAEMEEELQFIEDVNLGREM